jgi:hypothetical protein
MTFDPRKFKRRKRVVLKTESGEDIQVFRKQLKGITDQILEGNFSEIHIKVENEGLVASYKTSFSEGKIILNDIKNK